MAYILFCIIIIAFSIIGFIECIKGIIFRLFKNKNDKTVMLISPVFDTSEDIEYILRSCAVKVRWMGKVRPYRVVCLDNGMDKNTRQICDLICSEYEFMSVMTPSELNELLQSKEQV